MCISKVLKFKLIYVNAVPYVWIKTEYGFLNFIILDPDKWI